MRKLFLISITLITILSCAEPKLNKGGYFLAKNNDLFYGLYINSSMDTLNFYILTQYSSSDTEEEIESRKDFKSFRSGLIQIKENEIAISDFESDIVPSGRPVTKNFKFQNGQIVADCENLFHIFFGATSNRICENENIIFVRMEK